ncbi:hypothetical protein CK203_059836 [Vitis vinifera]|uniref:Mitochondrial protein n=1 Tax=Vitis vinifera TaxID=29760 RepID=A0A438GG26_VITVI|nr:hypothetical protein CK203_059836 [Vitis vinifera]
MESENVELNESSHSLVPEVSPLENIPKNCGKPPNRYSPDIGEKKSKYPIANYMSTQRLSEPLKAFVHQLSSCHIPKSIEEALLDPRWVQAIKEELDAL